jgi:integrase
MIPGMPKHRESPIKRVNPSGKVRWVARYTTPDGTRRSAGTFAKQREAQAAIDAAYEQPVANRDTLGAYARDWTTRRPRSERTNVERESKLRRVLDVQIEGRAFRDWPLAELRRRHTLDLVDVLLREQGRAASGAANILRVLSVLAEDAITDELMGVNPFRGVKIRESDPRVTKPKAEKRVWSLEDMHRFAACSGAYEPMVRMLSDCGLRLGEMLALIRAEQDLKAGLFAVKGTAWNGRYIPSSREKRHDRQGPIPPSCLTLLRDWPRRLDTRWLFYTPGYKRTGKIGRDHPGGCLWIESNFRRDVWTPAQDAAGIDPTPQEFRHSWVTHLRAAGVDGADLAEVAGHSEAVADGVYRHALRRSFDQIREVIG